VLEDAGVGSLPVRVAAAAAQGFVP
jgi:hypothetical protein